MKGRRLVAAALLAGAALLGAASSAWADSPQGGWTDPSPNGQIDGVPVAVLQTNGQLKGVAEFSQGIATVTFKLEKDAVARPDQPCSAASGVQPQNKAGGGSSHVEFAFTATFPCNRRYEVSATVTPVQKPLRRDSDLVLDLYIDVAIPPPATTGLDAAVAGRRVALTWDSAGQQMPDFEGFEIRRASGGGPFEALADVGTDATSYTDTAVPGAGGTFHYRVLQVRSGPEAGTVVYGPDGSTADAKVVPAETTTEPPAGGGDGSTGAGGSGGTGGSTSSGAGTAVLPTGHGTQSAHREFQVPGRETPTTVDSGFGQTLPFGKRKPGSSGAPGGSAIANLDSGGGDDGRRQTLVLVAGGTTTFSWAMALRFMSRRAAGV
jgi:hypothetical protein